MPCSDSCLEEYEHLRDEIDRLRDVLRIPEHTLSSLKLWVDHGVVPGAFLTAVLCDEPASVVATAADEFNAVNIVNIYRHLVNNCPRDCWGSREKFSAWAVGNKECAE